MLALRITVNALLATVLAILTMQTAYAASIPGDSEIEAQFKIKLPGFWSVDDFDVTESSNYGTEVEPVIKKRFIAEMILQADTFLLEKVEGPVTWIRTNAKKGAERKLYGIATLSRKGGIWKIEFALDNNPLTKLGQPIDFYTGKVIIVGSTEEKKYRESLVLQRAQESDQKHREVLEERKRQEELKIQERVAKLAEIAFLKKLEEAKKERLKRLVEARIVKEIPGYWKLTELIHQAADAPLENRNTAIDRKFSATVELARDLFVEKEKVGPVHVIEPTAKKGETRKIDLIATVASLEDDPSVSLTIANPITDKLGEPADYFSGKYVIAGTPEEEIFRKERHAAAMARQKEKNELEEAKRQAELKKIAHEKKLREEKHKIDLLRAAFQAELEENNKKFAAEMRAKQDAARRLRIEKFRKAILTGDEGAKLDAFQKMVGGPDKSLQGEGIDLALSSKSAKLRVAALRRILANAETITGSWKYSDGSQQPLTLYIDKFDERSGRFTGSIVGGPHISCSSRQRGQGGGILTGATLTFSHKYCSLSVSHETGSQMKGRFSKSHAVLNIFR